MKKINYLIFLLVLFISIPSICFASTKIICERTEDNNYGANKNDVTFNNSNLYKVSSIPCVDATEYVYDFANVLTEKEEKEIAIILEEFENKYNIAIMYYTFEFNYVYGEERKVDDFAHDFYDLNDFGIDYNTYSGVYLFENDVKYGYDSDSDGVDDGFYFNAGSKGLAQLYFYDDRLDSSLDEIYNELKYGDKVLAIKNWVNYLEGCYKNGPLEDYTIDEKGNLVYVRKFHPNYIVFVFSSFVITTVVILILVKRNKMVKKATEASDYVDKSSIVFDKKSDTFITSKTTSYTVSSSSGGSGGGHSSGGGSFSGGHSSGGGRH